MTATALPQSRPTSPSLVLRVWRFFCSVKLVFVWLTLLVVICLIGTFVIQAPIFVQEVPFLYAEWLEVAARPRFGDATDIMSSLGLFTLFQSPWLRVLLAVLSVHIVICTLNRYPAIAKALFHPQVRRNEAFYERSSHLTHFQLPDGSGPATVREALQRNGYRVAELQEGGASYVYGDRNGWAKLATFASHLGLIILVVGALISSATAFERELIIPDGQTQPLFPVSHPEQVQILNRGFGLDRYDDGRPSDFYSDLVLFSGGQQVAEKRIRVNDPLDYNGYIFYQATFGKSVDIEITDETGAVLFSENTSLLDQLGDIAFREVLLPSQELSLVVALVPEADQPQSTVPQPLGQTAAQLSSRLAILGFRPSENPRGPIFNIGLLPGETRMVDRITITNRGESFWTGLRVRKDPGVNIILIGSILFIVFTCITFYFPRTRVWARIRGNEVAISGNGDRFVDVKKSLGRIADATR